MDYILFFKTKLHYQFGMFPLRSAKHRELSDEILGTETAMEQAMNVDVEPDIFFLYVY